MEDIQKEDSRGKGTGGTLPKDKIRATEYVNPFLELEYARRDWHLVFRPMSSCAPDRFVGDDEKIALADKALQAGSGEQG